MNLNLNEFGFGEYVLYILSMTMFFIEPQVGISHLYHRWYWSYNLKQQQKCIPHDYEMIPKKYVIRKRIERYIASTYRNTVCSKTKIAKSVTTTIITTSLATKTMKISLATQQNNNNIGCNINYNISFNNVTINRAF